MSQLTPCRCEFSPRVRQHLGLLPDERVPTLPIQRRHQQDRKKSGAIFPGKRYSGTTASGTRYLSWMRSCRNTSCSPTCPQPLYLPKFGEIRVWYGEDFKNWNEIDNHGKVCVDVYGTLRLEFLFVSRGCMIVKFSSKNSSFALNWC